MTKVTTVTDWEFGVFGIGWEGFGLLLLLLDLVDGKESCMYVYSHCKSRLLYSCYVRSFGKEVCRGSETDWWTRCQNIDGWLRSI